MRPNVPSAPRRRASQPRAGLLLVLALLSGCALAARHARRNLDADRLAHARELNAEQRAPLAFQRYRSARRAAERSSEQSGARGDLQTEALLWLELAIAQAEREHSAEQRLEEERALVELDAKIVALQTERSELARANELRAAQALARQEAERALARAAQRPELRVKMPREEVKRAAEGLIARAELVALTLTALGKESAALARLREKVSETRALLAKEPEASLTRADQTLFFALSLLETVRSPEGAPASEERAALAEELALAGLRVTRDDRGLLALLARPFAGEQLRPESARVLQRLCTLMKAHPSGAIHLQVGAKTQPQAEARMRALRERLARGECSGARYAFTASADEREGEALEASFLAY